MSESYEIGKGKPPRGWPKGVSGNPGGRPKGSPQISGALLKILRTAPDETYALENKADVLAWQLFKSATMGDTFATREILDRTEGKVSQQLAITAQQIPTSEIVDRLVAAFTAAGIDELAAQKVLLMLSAGDGDGE